MRETLAAALVAAFFVLVVPIASPAQDRAFEKAVLDNGMAVVSQGNGGELAAACLFVRVGSAYEDKGNSGITNLLNNVILSCHPVGGANPASLKVEQLGGRVSVETHRDFTCFSLVVPVRNLGKALQVMADAVARPDCSDAALRIEKEGLLAREDGIDDIPVDRAFKLLMRESYNGLPYGLDPEGEREAVKRIGHGELDAWRRAYYGPENMLLSVCGRIDILQVAGMADEAFGNEPSTKKDRPGQKSGGPGGPIKGKIVVEDHARPGRAAAVVGYTAPPVGLQEYAAMRLADAVLAGGMGSRLFRVLREDSDLAYSFGSFMPAMKDTSRLVFYVSTDDERLGPAVEAVRKSVEALKTGDFSDDELARARGVAAGRVTLEQETALGRARQAGFYELMGVGADYGTKLARQVERLGRDDVARAAKKYMDDYTLVFLKPVKGNR